MHASEKIFYEVDVCCMQFEKYWKTTTSKWPSKKGTAFRLSLSGS
jgi:hypothetical protein